MKSVVFLLDVSGSMEHKKATVVNVANETLTRLYIECSGDDIYVKIYTFNEVMRVLYEGPLHVDTQVTLEQLITEGNTALYDALGTLLQEITEGTTLVIATDGEDNKSDKYDIHDICDMIADAKRNKQLKINYLCEGKEAFECGTQIGLTQGDGVHSMRVERFDSGVPIDEFAASCVESVKSQQSNKRNKTQN